MNIYIGKPVEYSDMQGPCAAGFHIPLITEWQGLNTIIQGLSLSETGGNKVRVNLHMPLAGQRTFNTGGTGDQYEFGYYWSSSADNNGESTYSYRYYFNFHSNYIADDYSSGAGCGYSIRPFKDEFVLPTSGWTVINGTLGGAGIFWNQTDGIISITSDGSTGYTIADKNLGATVVYNNGDTLSQSNCGYYYQRGNNYGFAWTGSITTSSTKVNAENYGPGNYYESSKFVTSSSTPYGWDSSHNQNLRGGVSQGTSTKSTEVKNIYIGEYIQPVSLTFVYTGSDQNYTIPHDGNYKITAKGAGSRSAAGGLGEGVFSLTKGTVLSIMVGANGGNGNGTKYGFGGSANGGTNAAGGGLSGVFTGSGAITVSDSARALVIGGGAGGSSAGTGGAGGGNNGGTGTGSYGTAGAGGTQTGHGSGGNQGSGQFRGGNGSGTYGYGGGGGWRGGNGSIGDGSGDDDKGGGGGSGYVLSTASSRVLTLGGGSAAGYNGVVTIVEIR